MDKLLQPLGLTIPAQESADYERLLAAVHDCAVGVSHLPDYQPVPDTTKYPRQNIHLPDDDEQDFGHAWVYRFHIRGSSSPNSTVPLSGKTVCVKDCIAIAGVPQTFGSDAFPAWTPETDATVVTRVLDAGADVVGTATCENFCNSTASYTSAQGTVHNPYQVGYSAGGSTSGGAALVGSGKIDIALGTDQGGSIRVPASFCGCVGLKPTHGLVPFTGITSGDPIDDHAGPICQSVAEAAACLDAIAGYDNIDDRSLGAATHGSFGFSASLKSGGDRVDGMKIGLLNEGFYQTIVDVRVRDHVLMAAQKFESLGATVEEVSIPLHLQGPSIWTLQQRMSGSSGLLGQATGRRGLGLTGYATTCLPWTDSNFQKLFPSTKNVLINGLYLSERFPGLYSKTINIARQIRDAYQRMFEHYDVIIMPTTPFVATRQESWASVLDSFTLTIGLTTNTAVFNVTGHPAMSIPVGFLATADNSAVQLPVGMQIVGGMWQEKKVLHAGHAWEANFNWRQMESNTVGGSGSTHSSLGVALTDTAGTEARTGSCAIVNGTIPADRQRVKLSA